MHRRAEIDVGFQKALSLARKALDKCKELDDQSRPSTPLPTLPAYNQINRPTEQCESLIDFDGEVPRMEQQQPTLNTTQLLDRYVEPLDASASSTHHPVHPAAEGSHAAAASPDGIQRLRASIGRLHDQNIQLQQRLEASSSPSRLTNNSSLSACQSTDSAEQAHPEAVIEQLELDLVDSLTLGHALIQPVLAAAQHGFSICNRVQRRNAPSSTAVDDETRAGTAHSVPSHDGKASSQHASHRPLAAYGGSEGEVRAGACDDDAEELSRVGSAPQLQPPPAMSRPADDVLTIIRSEDEPSEIKESHSVREHTSVKLRTVDEFLANCTEVQLAEMKRQV